MNPEPQTPTPEKLAEGRCCRGVVAVWNQVYGVSAVILPPADPGHQRIDFIAHDQYRGLVLSIEHGLLLTVPQSRRAERFVAQDVKPFLIQRLTPRLVGFTRIRLLSRRSSVPRDVAERVLYLLESDPTLLARGDRELRDTSGLLGSISVDTSPGLPRRLLCGTSAEITKEAALADLERRLKDLVLEERRKYEGGAPELAPKAGVRRLLVVECADWVNLGDTEYSRLFDSVATAALLSGLDSVWRAAADGEDEVHFWLEWSKEFPVADRRRFFRWMERGGSVEEL